ncbi:MAG: GNAT family N-acetyltransferase [Oscillospiraceae bacterium]|nr:GNAT family N-acetyltransferase [Oscillospiraceae bacterium]
MFRFNIMAAKHSNAKEVCKISQKVLGAEMPFEKMKTLFVEIIEDIEQIIMIAVHSGHTVGFIHARIVRDLVRGRYTEIVGIALLPYYRNRGCGISLIFAAEQWSSQMLVNKLQCNLKSDNEAVKSLLKKCGYLENGLEAFEKTIL